MMEAIKDIMSILVTPTHQHKHFSEQSLAVRAVKELLDSSCFQAQI